VQLIKGAVEAVKLLKAAGFKLIIISNQSGIGRGYVTKKKVCEINDHLLELLKNKGAALDAAYFCPHLPTDGCECRKPNLGLVNRAAVKYGLDLKRSYAVGDHLNDFRLGENMGGKGIFVLTGHGRSELKKLGGSKLKPYKITKDILSAAKFILRETK
jgi:D-glycero-D-manno-heptose 1,7-bisphosphate phosphatase